MTTIPIIYEDNHLLVVQKPPNILSQEDRTGDQDMLRLLKKYIKVEYNKPGNVYLGLVHRLDRPVGGVMVFAKTSKAAARISEQIRKSQFKRTYMAVIHGAPEPTKGTLIHHLLKDPRTNRVKAVAKDVKGARRAVLDYTTLEVLDKLSLVKINLHTGRPHQIRVQFTQIGHPLYGDQRYGFKDKGRQIALWAYEIEFEHPTLRKTMTFSRLSQDEYPWKIFSPIRDKNCTRPIKYIPL